MALKAFVDRRAKAMFLAHTLPHLLYGVRGSKEVDSDPFLAVFGAFWLWIGFRLCVDVENGVSFASKPRDALIVNRCGHVYHWRR